MKAGILILIAVVAVAAVGRALQMYRWLPRPLRSAARIGRTGSATEWRTWLQRLDAEGIRYETKMGLKQDWFEVWVAKPDEERAEAVINPS